MNKKVFRLYSTLIGKQEVFLNKMADEGWRLVKTSWFSYEFEPCKPKEYEYRVIFVSEKFYYKDKDCRTFFEDLGYDVLIKSINLNLSKRKTKSIYNNDIVILGKKRDGEQFYILNFNNSMVNYYSLVLSIYISLIVFVGLFLFTSFLSGFANSLFFIIVGLICLVLILLIIKYAKKIKYYKDL